MLQGVVRFKDADLGQVEYMVYARDSFDDLRLYLVNDSDHDVKLATNANLLFDKHVLPFSRSDFKANKLVDGDKYYALAEQGQLELSKDGKGHIAYPYADLPPSYRRRLDIKKTNKFSTNITNRDFASKVSALVRYAVSHSVMNYNQNIDLSGASYFDSKRVVQIDNVGYLKYDTGLLSEVNLKSPFVEIILHSIPDNENPVGSVFTKLKKEDNYGNILSVTPIETLGFSMSSDLLGFEYVSETANIVGEHTVFGMHQSLADVVESHPDKNLSWLKDRKYTIVNDSNLEEVMAMFNAFEGYIAYDTETTGLKINYLSRQGQSEHADVLVGVVLSVRKGEGFYFPLQHKAFPNLCNGDHNYFMEKYMRTLLETKKIIVHNLTFDWKVTYIYDILLNCVYDTMLAFGVTKGYENKSFRTGLKALTKIYFGVDMLDLGDFVTGSSFGNSGITFADLPYELVKNYAPADTDWTLALFEYLEHHDILGQYNARTVFDIEVNFAKVVAYSEFYGYQVNVPNVPTLTDTILGEVDTFKKKMFKITGYEFNPSSSVQLQKVLFDDVGITPKDKKRSTKKDMLFQYADEKNLDDSPRYPIVSYLLNYRNSEKLYTNFLKKLDQYATPDGFIFPNVFQLGTETGRTSSKEPNYQSYNNPVKKNIIPRPGYIHFDCDFSQIEYRVLASLAKQEQLMEDFIDPDLDYHTYQASRMFSIPYSLVSKELRGQSKGINFGLPFGMGDSSLGARIFGERTDATRKKATVLRRKFFAGQEKIEMFFDYTRSEGVRNNFTSTAFGRRRYYDRTTFDEQAIRRQAGNHVIQGTAADIYKQSVNRLFNRCIDENWLGKVLFNVFVHDELLTEVSEEINLYYFFKAWREEFELVIDGFCPLYAGAGVGHSWYEAKSQDLPQQYITEIIESYTPEMTWHGNGKKFIDDLNAGHEDYKIRRVRDFITAPENQGEIIKPIIGSLLTEMVNKAIDEYRASPESHRLITSLNEVLSEKGLVELVKPAGKKSHQISLLRDYLAVFAHRHNLDMDKINILSSDEAKPKTAEKRQEDIKIVFEDVEPSVQDLVELRGYHLSVEEGVIYLDNMPMTYNGQNTDVVNYLFFLKMFGEKGDYQVAVLDKETGEFQKFQAYIQSSGYTSIVQLYVTLKNMATALTW